MSEPNLQQRETDSIPIPFGCFAALWLLPARLLAFPVVWLFRKRVRASAV